MEYVPQRDQNLVVLAKAAYDLHSIVYRSTGPQCFIQFRDKRIGIRRLTEMVQCTEKRIGILYRIVCEELAMRI